MCNSNMKGWIAVKSVCFICTEQGLWFLAHFPSSQAPQPLKTSAVCFPVIPSGMCFRPSLPFPHLEGGSEQAMEGCLKLPTFYSGYGSLNPKFALSKEPLLFI